MTNPSIIAHHNGEPIWVLHQNHGGIERYMMRWRDEVVSGRTMKECHDKMLEDLSRPPCPAGW